MDHVALALHLAGDGDEAGTEHHRPEALEQLRPDDDIGDVGLVLDGHEDHAARRAGPLADDGEAGDGDAAAAPRVAERLVRDDAAGGEARPDERHRMRLQRQAEIAVVVDDMLPDRHRRQRNVGLAPYVGMGGDVEQRQPVVGPAAAEVAGGPQRVAPVEAEGAEGVGIGEPLDRRPAEARAEPEVADRIVAPAAGGDERRRIVLGEALDLPEPEPDRVGGADLVGHRCVDRVKGDMARWRNLGASFEARDSRVHLRMRDGVRLHRSCHVALA